MEMQRGQVGCQEVRPETVANSSTEANVRGLGIQQQVPAHDPKYHVELAMSQGRAVQGIQGQPGCAIAYREGLSPQKYGHLSP